MEVKLKHTKVLKASEDLEVGDQIKVGGIYGEIAEVAVNGYDQMLLVLTLVGVTIKKRQKATLIIAKKLPVNVLK